MLQEPYIYIYVFVHKYWGTKMCNNALRAAEDLDQVGRSEAQWGWKYMIVGAS